jgi:hypothetical protein
MKMIHNRKMNNYLIIDKWYSEEEEYCVWKELDFYQTTELEKGEETIIAKGDDGEPLGKHLRIHLNSLYNPQFRNKSHILRLSTKIQNETFHKKVLEANPIYGRNFTSTNHDYNLISYYEDKHFYKPHIDSFLWTMLIWFYKKPKNFTGGELVFVDRKEIIELKHNRMILFPSYFLHEVTPIQVNKDFKKGDGRYTITKFLNYR